MIPKDAIITVAGTVGIGKSTFTRALAERLSFQTSFEKVDGNPYLESFYSDFKRWSFHLQIYFLAERFKEQKRMQESGGGFVQDRSIYEDTEIFAKMLMEEGNMTQVDYETYTSLFDAMVMTPYFPTPDVLIFLDADFDQIIERIQERGREMEQETPIDYWKTLYERYQNWIKSFTLCPVVHININEYDVMQDIGTLDPIIEKIEEAISKKRNI